MEAKYQTERMICISLLQVVALFFKFKRATIWSVCEYDPASVYKREEEYVAHAPHDLSRFVFFAAKITKYYKCGIYTQENFVIKPQSYGFQTIYSKEHFTHGIEHIISYPGKSLYHYAQQYTLLLD